MYRLIPPAPPATPAMRLKDLQTGLRGLMAIAIWEADATWNRGPGHYVGVREVLYELLGHVREHERRLTEVSAMIEGSGDGVITHEDLRHDR